MSVSASETQEDHSQEQQQNGHLELKSQPQPEQDVHPSMSQPPRRPVMGKPRGMRWVSSYEELQAQEKTTFRAAIPNELLQRTARELRAVAKKVRSKRYADMLLDLADELLSHDQTL